MGAQSLCARAQFLFAGLTWWRVALAALATHHTAHVGLSVVPRYGNCLSDCVRIQLRFVGRIKFVFVQSRCATYVMGVLFRPPAALGFVAHLRFILFLSARGTPTVTRQTLGATACSLDRKLCA